MTSSSLNGLETEIDQAMHGDRFGFRRRLRAIRDAQKAGRPFDRNLRKLQQDVQTSAELLETRRRRVPAITYDESLPVAARREEITAAIRDHQVVIVCGETGSGKSTQLPKICLELGRGVGAMIGHTQPRRIAARTVAARIAEEVQGVLGQEVGYKVRFADATRPETYVKLMTDGILLAETQHDRFLNQYDTIIVDEAHERSLNIDFLLGYLKRLLPTRPELRLIITSATIDAARFAQHFAAPQPSPPVIEVSGRTYPVDVLYRPPEIDEDGREPDWQQSVCDAIDELTRIDRGDMLIFLPTERHIRDLSHTLKGRLLHDEGKGKTEILPLYGRLSIAEQTKVFQPQRKRRIVLATNVAESSLTVPNIRFVIDSGVARISRYAPRSKVQRLPIEAISQASADQRKGRCGRVGPGVCVRLYSEDDYNSRDRYTTPEIQRTNLASVILQTMAMRLGPVEEFPFLDGPKPQAIRDGYKTLFELGAIDDQGELTPLGQRLSRLPVDPRIGRMVLAAQQENCLDEVLIIAAALEVQDPRERPLDQQEAADAAHRQFDHPDSDFLTYINIWEFYHRLRSDLSRNQLRKACRQNFISSNRMREWLDVHRQLKQMVAENIDSKENKRAKQWRKPQRETAKPAAQSSEQSYAPIHRSLLTGLLSNIAYRTDAKTYKGAESTPFHLWPGSAIAAKRPPWIVAAELVETTRRYLRTAARINPDWIEPLADHLVHRSYSDPHWSRKAASAMAFEKVTLFGLTVVARRRVRYGAIDANTSRHLMIEQGLVQGDWDLRADFVDHNRQVLERIAAGAAKSRRRDLLVEDDAVYSYYNRRIPADVSDGARLRKWLQETQALDPHVLFMSEEDVLQSEGILSEQMYPDKVDLGEAELPLVYRYEPGEADDGVTLTVPREGIRLLSAERLGWLVPGLLEEKIIALIRSLPKSIRRQFVPAPETAKKALAELPFGQGPFLEAVAAALSDVAGERITARDFQPNKLPPHLQMNVRVVDEKGAAVAEGRDVKELHKELGDQAVESLASLSDNGKWRRDGITTWDLGDLPERIEIERGGLRFPAYPALTDEGKAAALRLFDTAAQAKRHTRGGVRRLVMIAESRELCAQAQWLPGLSQMAIYASGYCGAKELENQFAELIADRAFLESGDIPRSEAEFLELLKAGRKRIPQGVREVTKLSSRLWEGYHQARLALEKATSQKWRSAVDDMRLQLSELTTPHFMVVAPWNWLSHYPRYFAAIVQRVDKLRGGLARDLEQFERDLAPRLEAYRQRVTDHQGQGKHCPQLELYRWMLEEFRVSLFAQSLGTSMKISTVRLDKQWAKIE